jgi:cytochrome c553
LNHRIVATIVRLVLLFFAASGLVFALAVRGPAPPGPGLPATHRSFAEGTCGTCHAPP